MAMIKVTYQRVVGKDTCVTGTAGLKDPPFNYLDSSEKNGKRKQGWNVYKDIFYTCLYPGKLDQKVVLHHLHHLQKQS